MQFWLPTVAILLTTALLAVRTGRAEAHLVEHIDRQVNHLRRVITMSVQDAVNAITGTLRKAQAEIVAKIADVQAQLDAAGVAEDIDLSELTAAAQALDDVVPDAPAPTDDVPADVPVDVPADVPADAPAADGV